MRGNFSERRGRLSNCPFTRRLLGRLSRCKLHCSTWLRVFDQLCAWGFPRLACHHPTGLELTNQRIRRNPEWMVQSPNNRQSQRPSVVQNLIDTIALTDHWLQVLRSQPSLLHLKFSSIPPRATKINQPLTVLSLVGTHEVFFPNLGTVVPQNVVCSRNVKEKLWHAIFQCVVFNS